MIILPVRVGELLGDVDDTRAALLALDFAEYALDVQADALDPRLYAVCRAYTSAAREAVGPGRAPERLVRASDEFFTVGTEFPGHSAVTGVAEWAVRIGCQEMLEAAGALSPASRIKVTVRDVATRVQSDLGRWYAQQTPDDPNRAKADRAARWEEARRQLLHIITTEPNPHTS
ncbi:hypothetical protein ACIQNU_00350 [Streptomyces sp. NPDC091292]|uniref:hypothetical protein n=1 Tax=Streptomyces sp. NPDC091292 TaxID=3365991 RepID=UPI003805ABC8